MKKRERDLTSKRAYRGMTQEQAEAAEKKHREVLSVLTGLLLVQFLGMLANTIVSNAMPVIVAEIGGNQTHYTWILTSGILANTVMTALSGKLADLYDKKKLFIISMVLFILASLLCGLATSPEMLIAFRVLQGIAMGMQVMMSMVIMATVIPPRERGRYNGYMGAVMAVATVSGPLMGGLIVDTPWLGWRWCFWVTIPFMLSAIWVISKRLDLKQMSRGKVHLDIPGAALMAIAAVSFLLWVSMVGASTPFTDPVALLLIAIAIVATVLFILVERKSPEPLIPMEILLHRNTVLAVVGVIGAGTIMFGANVFLGQYFQYGRGYSPTVAGLLTLPMMVGIVVASTWVGQLITKNGVWKRYVVSGMALLTASAFALCFARQDTNLGYLGVVFFAAGWGLGAANQNLVLAVQNTVPLSQMGAATSTVTFFRNLGGALGIQVLGAAYTAVTDDYMIERLGSLPEVPAGASGALDLGALPDDVEMVAREAFGNSLWAVFLASGIILLIGTIATALMKGTSLRDTVDIEKKVHRTLREEEIQATQAAAAMPAPVEPSLTQPNLPEEASSFQASVRAGLDENDPKWGESATQQRADTESSKQNTSAESDEQRAGDNQGAGNSRAEKQ